MSRGVPISLLVLMGLTACETEEVTIPTGLRGEAASNPLLAAERTLEELGLEVEAQRGLLPLPERGTFVVTSGAELAVEGPTLSSFLDWVEGGGHALVCLDGFKPLVDELPEQTGDRDPAFEGLDRARPEDALARALAYERLSWGDAETWLAEIEGFDVELPPASGWLSDGRSDAAGGLRFERGAGSVRVVPSGVPFANLQLGDHDHARALYAWVAERPAVRLALGLDAGLWGLLVERMPEALLAGLALLLLWLWRASSRFGPLVPMPEAAVHGFTLHVAAAGRFLWRHDRGPALLAALRARTLRRAEQKLAHRASSPASGGSRRDLLEAIAERTGRPVDELDATLFSAEALRPRDLTPLVRDLVRLHQEL